MVTLVTMYDTIHTDAGNIPASAEKIAGYVTGSPDVKWTPADWGRLQHAGRVRIDQSAGGTAYGAGQADVYDIETRAGTAPMFGAIALARHKASRRNCPYASPTNLQAAARELDKAQGGGWWHGMDAWLTDPSLSLAEASKLVGTTMHGFKIRAVQWAWPSTNPDTAVPGGTLKKLNLDLSIADEAWFPAPGAVKPPPPAWQNEILTLCSEIDHRLNQIVSLVKENQ